MKVIHDDDLAGIMMIPLIVGWRIKETCQVKDCTERTNTIIAFTADETPNGQPMNIGICETHYRESKKSGKFHYTIIP